MTVLKRSHHRKKQRMNLPKITMEEKLTIVEKMDLEDSTEEETEVASEENLVEVSEEEGIAEAPQEVEIVQ